VEYVAVRGRPLLKDRRDERTNKLVKEMREMRERKTKTEPCSDQKRNEHRTRIRGK
jgi:hypothetical protein